MAHNTVLPIIQPQKRRNKLSRPIQLYCPNCKRYQIVRVSNSYDSKAWTGDHNHKLYFKENPDITWHRRVRQCSVCDQQFSTAEIEERYLDELVQLRKSVVQLRSRLERYENASNSARDAVSLYEKASNSARDALSRYEKASNSARNAVSRYEKASNSTRDALSALTSALGTIAVTEPKQTTP